MKLDFNFVKACKETEVELDGVISALGGRYIGPDTIVTYQDETIKKYNAKEISDQNINIEKEYLNIFNSIINNIINEHKIIPISLKLIPFSSNGTLEKEGKLDSEE